MIRKCLFPAAGYGTRFLPATKAMPKEMLPLLTKPLIQYGVEEAVEAGMNIISVITGRGKRAIEDHFDISYELERQIEGSEKEELLEEIRKLINRCTFSYTRQIQMRGLGDAILKGEVLIGNEPFGVVLADDYCTNFHGDSVLKQLVEIYKKYKCPVVAIMEVEKNSVSKYGIIDGKKVEDDIFIVNNMIEKPSINEAPTNLAIIGRYILTPEIFEVLKNTKPGKNGEIQITDALMTLAQSGMVIAYKFKGKRFDCGSVEGYVEATNYLWNINKKN